MKEQIEKEAKRLIEKFYNYQAHQVSVETRKAVAKEHSLICIDEILDKTKKPKFKMAFTRSTESKQNHIWDYEYSTYWQQVKQYIEDNY